MPPTNQMPQDHIRQQSVHQLAPATGQVVFLACIVVVNDESRGRHLRCQDSSLLLDLVLRGWEVALDMQQAPSVSKKRRRRLPMSLALHQDCGRIALSAFVHSVAYKSETAGMTIGLPTDATLPCPTIEGGNGAIRVSGAVLAKAGAAGANGVSPAAGRPSCCVEDRPVVDDVSVSWLLSAFSAGPCARSD